MTPDLEYYTVKTLEKSRLFDWINKFSEEKIDDEVLPDLKIAHLLEIGMTRGQANQFINTRDELGSVLYDLKNGFLQRIRPKFEYAHQ